jgi:hypothetical protein
LDYFEIRLRVLLKNSEIYLKNGKKGRLGVSWRAGELKFGRNMLCLFKLKIAYPDLEFLEIHLRNLAISVWVEARELKFSINMLC